MGNPTDVQFADATRQLAEWAAEYDRTGQWPARSIALLADLGGWRWNIPAEFGGEPLSHVGLLRAYAALAAGCMNTALISTQRDGAVELIATSPNETAKRDLLPRLARGELFTTVGIAQLTTSKRGGEQMLRATPADDGGYRLDGFIPWATGADHADFVVAGAVLADGNQLLLNVYTDRPGVQVQPPDAIMALAASRTSSLRVDNYFVPAGDILRGPAEQVLNLRTPVKPLVTSACGIGVADALVAIIASLRPGVRSHFADVLEPVIAQYREVRTALFAAADKLNDPTAEISSTDMRVRVNDVLIRLAITALTVCKGSGMLLDNPVQRHFREAMFFLVWSAPAGVQIDTLAHLFAPPADTSPGDGL
jgi:alkylation response protein AidB-like acyl-CoA dehydrogenase